MPLRAGRANPKMLDRIMVDYYGTPTPVNKWQVYPLQTKDTYGSALGSICSRTDRKAIMSSDSGLILQTTEKS